LQEKPERMKYLICLLFSLLTITKTLSQQDCTNAIPVCQTTKLDGLTGIGDADFFPGFTDAGCLGDENNSIWVYFQIDASSPNPSTLAFTIAPVGGLGEDYDWALFAPGAFCGALGIPIRCSAAPANCGNCPNTGLQFGEGFPLDIETKASGDGYLPIISVIPGESYYLLINNFSGNAPGFQISFGGSAILDCTPDPPCQMQVFAPIDITVCQAETLPFDVSVSELGGGGLVDWEWTAVPAIAVSFLDDPTSQKPTITIPQTFSGVITYTVRGINPICSDVEEYKITVLPAPIVTLQPLPNLLCTTQDPIQLTFNPPGGFFTGFGPVDPSGILDPSNWGDGFFTLTYSVAAPNGCVSNDEIDLEIYAGPNAEIEFLPEICVSDAFGQVFAAETGGIWTGPVNQQGIFFPPKLGPGTYPISYTLTDGFCTSKEESVIVIVPLPIVTISDPGPSCTTSLKTIVNVTPKGGKWIGIPDTSNTFNPSLLGPGSYNSIYSYIDLYGCKNADTIQFIINEPPFATVSTTAQICNSTDNNNTTILNFSDFVTGGDKTGTWTDLNGSGATGTLPISDFNGVAPGFYDFRYTTKSAKAPCTEETYILTVEVVECKCPLISLVAGATLCNDNDNLDLSTLVLNSNTGNWSITSTPSGVNDITLSGSLINATGADAGNYTLTFTLINTPPAGCPLTGTSTILVNALPQVNFSSVKPILCNKTTGSFPTQINLFGLISSGDLTGIWIDQNGSGASGPSNNLNFLGVAPGTYVFQYTTNNAVAPCTNISKDITIEIQDCDCPNTDLTNLSSWCNSTASIDLNSLKLTPESGLWSIKPSGLPNPATLTGSNLNILNKSQGNYIITYTLSNVPPAGCPASADLTIELSDQPAATVAPDITVCNSSSGGQNTSINFSGLILSGDNFGTWTKIDPVTTTGTFPNINFNGATPGTYTFNYSLLANAPCTDVNLTTVVIVKNCDCPPLGFSSNNEICGDNNATLNLNSLVILADPGIWSVKTKPAGSGNNLITANQLNLVGQPVGNYVLTYTLNTNPPVGCPPTADVIVSVIAPPSVTLLPGTIVCNSTGSGQYIAILDLFSLISSGDKTGTWQDTNNSGSTGPSNLKDFTGVAPGTYIFTYTTGNAQGPCSEVSKTISITVENCACLSVATSSPGTQCTSTGLLNLQNFTITTIPGTWSVINSPAGSPTGLISNNQFNLTGAISGVYTIQFNLNQTPPQGCPTNSTQTITVVKAQSAGSAAAPIGFCINNATFVQLGNQLSGADQGGTWSEISNIPSIGNSSNIIAGQFNAAGQNSGTYTLRYTVSPGNPCPSAFTDVIITVNPNPIADAGVDQELTCIITQATIGSLAAAGLNYQWTGGNLPNPNSSVNTTDIPGTYILTVTNAITGCTNSDQVIVKASSDIPAPVKLITRNISCSGENDGKIQFESFSGGVGPFEVFLNGTSYQQAQFFNKLGAGIYILEIVDANGCESKTIIELTEPIIAYLELGADVTIDFGDSLLLEPFINIPLSEIDTIIWDPLINKNCPGCFEHYVYPYFSTPLRIKVIQKNGCMVEDIMNIKVNVNRPLYMGNAFSPNDDLQNDRFYPFAGDLVTNIELFQIFDRWGNLIYQANDFEPGDYDSGWDGMFNGKKCNTGVYVYVVVAKFIDGASVLFKGDVNLMR